MLVGLWGPHSIGKTTFMKHLTAKVIDLPKSKQLMRLVLVQADLEREWSAVDGWRTIKRWKIPQIKKRALIQDMIADDCHLYIVESARYFSGMYPVLVNAFKQSYGGLYFIIPTASPDDLKYFIQQRCIMTGKTYRSDVWGPRARYESDLRYSNPMRKWLLPAGIPCECFTIERDRKAWKQIEQSVWRLIGIEPDDWYYTCGYNPKETKLVWASK